MSASKRPANLAASVRARLLNLARDRKLEFQRVLSDYAIERLLYRLGVSDHAERFVLKGAMLFRVWSIEPHRATWDLDLLGRGGATVGEMVTVIRDLCSMPVGDGIVFDTADVRGEEIRTAGAYAGARIHFDARLAEARIPVQVDIGFGDAVVPAPVRESYPVLLDQAPPMILVYPREAVVAEKLEAMVTLGVTNSRMKDFYDVYVLASIFPFDGQLLTSAIRATFERRGTPIPDVEPTVLTHEFLTAPDRATQWRAFLRRGRLDAPPDPGELSEALRTFLIPVLSAMSAGQAFPAVWPAGGPWRQESKS